MIAKYMSLWVILAAAGAFLCPSAVSSVLSKGLIAPLLGVVMFGMGLTMQPKDFVEVAKRPYQVLVGTLAQFILMPVIAWTLTKLFNLPPEIAIGVILVGACPGGTASNVICYLAKGDVALSISLTTVSTLLAPIMTPLLVWWLGGSQIEVNASKMFVSILEVVLLPVLLGLVVNYLCSRLKKNPMVSITKFLPSFSALAVVVIVAIVVAGAANKLMEHFGLLCLVVILHNLCGLGLGYLVGLLTSSPRTVAIEVGMQNSGLAVSLAVTHFAAQPLAAIPGAIFSVWHNISGSLFANLCRRTK